MGENCCRNRDNSSSSSQKEVWSYCIEYLFHDNLGTHSTLGIQRIDITWFSFVLAMAVDCIRCRFEMGTII